MSDTYEFMIQMAVFRDWSPPTPGLDDLPIYIRLRGMTRVSPLSKVTPEQVRRAIQVQLLGVDYWQTLEGIRVPEHVRIGYPTLDVPLAPDEHETGYQLCTAPREELIVRGTVTDVFLNDPGDEWCLWLLNEIKKVVTDE